MTKKSEQTRERILESANRLVMANGFAGTSIDDILKDAGLTKGAFFHYFKGKGDLARELIEQHARQDLVLFGRLEQEANAASDDPLEQMYVYLEGFEKYVSDIDDPPPGCMYATYTYEGMMFEPSIRDFVADTLRRWVSIYTRRFEDVLAKYKPAIPVTARQLGEMIASIVEGGLVFQKAYGDIRITARQSQQFRNYLELLFGPRSEIGKSKRKATKRAAPAKAYA